MKQNQLLTFLCVIAVLLAASCQKQYERPDITLPTGSGGSGGSGGGGNGTLLTKMVVATAGLTSTYEYSYDAAGQLSGISMNSLVGTQPLTYSWAFTRDNTGKMLQYTIKNNIPGFPANGITYKAHYPSGSNYFDYLRADYTFSGTVTKDSFALTVVGGRVTKVMTYGDYDNTGYVPVSGGNYTYDANGNVTAEEELDDLTGTGVLKVTTKNEYTYDGKVNPLQLGQEGFILGASRYNSKNNCITQVNTNFSVTPAVKSSLSYTIQYNAANKPVSVVSVDPNGGPSVLVTYTY